MYIYIEKHNTAALKLQLASCIKKIPNTCDLEQDEEQLDD